MPRSKIVAFGQILRRQLLDELSGRRAPTGPLHHEMGKNRAARAIVVEHAGGYGIGLDYARDMIKPA